MIIEVSGESRKDKATKTFTTRNFWIPAINNHGGFGKWAFLEISDPWDAKNIIRTELQRIGAFSEIRERIGKIPP